MADSPNIHLTRDRNGRVISQQKASILQALGFLETTWDGRKEIIKWIRKTPFVSQNSVVESLLITLNNELKARPTSKPIWP